MNKVGLVDEMPAVDQEITESIDEKTVYKEKKPSLLKRLFSSKPFRVLLILAVVAAVLWFGLIRGIMSGAQLAAGSTYLPRAVTYGDLKMSISGTGVVAPIQRFDVVSTVKGEVLTDTIEVGQQVSKDDVLYTIDNTDAQSSIKRAELSLERAKINYEQATDEQDDDTDTSITPAISGSISALYARNGDSVMKGAKIADLVDLQTLKLRVPFNTADAAALSVGGDAVITLEATGETLQGRIRKVTTGTHASASGAAVRDVEIIFANPGAVQLGDRATAQCGAYACNDAGTVDYGDKATVSSKASGELRGLSVSEGDRVSAGRSIAHVVVEETEKSDTAERTSSVGLEEAELALSDSKKQLDNYSVKSPISGTIVGKEVKAGDTLDAIKTTLAIVADMTSLTFTMNIDELDIGQVSVGQEVVVTAEALEGQAFQGKVDNIGILGSSQNGVTTFPVKVLVNEYGDLRPGMNVSGEITARQVTHVLQVPVGAVARGNCVLISEEAAKNLPVAAQNDQTPGKVVDMRDTPKGYKYVRVEIGFSDGISVEIKSGLEEGTEVFVAVAGAETFFGMSGGGMATNGNFAMRPAMGGGGTRSSSNGAPGEGRVITRVG